MLISELIRDMVTEINANLHFDLADEFYSNIKGDTWPTYKGDVVVLNDRFTSSWSFNKAGAITETITLEFMVLGQDQHLSDPKHTEKIVERCKPVASSLVRKIMKDKTIKDPARDITKTSANVVKHLFDRDLSGLLVRIEVPTKLSATC